MKLTNLRRLRNQEGLTQADLAKLSGLSQGHISDLEAGRRDPTLATAYALCVALTHPYGRKIKVEDLLKEEGPESQEVFADCNNGSYCPWCESRNLDQSQTRSNTRAQSCSDCGKAWELKHELVVIGYREIDESFLVGK